MFLKMVSALPDYIYASADDRLYVNMFIGSKSEIGLRGNRVAVSQETGYPWNGQVTVQVNPKKAGIFAVHVRIPGWARGVENPYGLYASDLKQAFTLKVNGKALEAALENGYAVIRRTWKKGDRVELDLPVKPRVITANAQVKDLQNQVAIAAGPVIYCVETADNADLDALKVDPKAPLALQYRRELLNGVNVITGKTGSGTGTFTAVPYYAMGNRGGKGNKVWLPVR